MKAQAFGKYLLLDRISVGGMAEVWRRSYGVEGFEKIIAIKRILPTMGEDRDFIKMFIDEAKIAGQLAHANICQIFELGRIDGSHFIAMEYIWGKDLLQIRSSRRRKRTHAVEMACFIVPAVSEGLDYAHRKRDHSAGRSGIVHRDVSPQNVLVSYDGEVKVIDFGIAKAAASRDDAGRRRSRASSRTCRPSRSAGCRSIAAATSSRSASCSTSSSPASAAVPGRDRLLDAREGAQRRDPPPRESSTRTSPPSSSASSSRRSRRTSSDRYQWASDLSEDLQRFLLMRGKPPPATTSPTSCAMNFTVDHDKERTRLESYRDVVMDEGQGSSGLGRGVGRGPARPRRPAIGGRAQALPGPWPQSLQVQIPDDENAGESTRAPSRRRSQRARGRRRPGSRHRADGRPHELRHGARAARRQTSTARPPTCRARPTSAIPTASRRRRRGRPTPGSRPPPRRPGAA